MEFIEQGSLKSIAKKNIIEVRFSSPGKRVANPAFRNKTMNMRIPLKVSAKGVEDANEAWSKEFGFIVFMKQTKDNTTDGGKEAVKERTVLKKEGTEFFGDGKNAVPVLDIDNLEGHGSSPVKRVFDPAGGAKSAVATERRKLEIATDRTAKHSPAKRGIAAMNHLVNVFNHGLARM